MTDKYKGITDEKGEVIANKCIWCDNWAPLGVPIDHAENCKPKHDKNERLAHKIAHLWKIHEDRDPFYNKPIDQFVNESVNLSHLVYGEMSTIDWTILMDCMNSGARVAIDESVFHYFLEVLPPTVMHRTLTLANGEKRRVEFGLAEGADYIQAFWKELSAYYCQNTLHISGGY